MSEERIQEEVQKAQKKKGFKKKKDEQVIQVYVSILEMEWISEHEKMVDFYRFISS